MVWSSREVQGFIINRRLQKRLRMLQVMFKWCVYDVCTNDTFTGVGGGVSVGAGCYGRGERSIIALGGAVYCVLGCVCGDNHSDGHQRGVDPGCVPNVEHPPCSVGAACSTSTSGSSSKP